MDKKGRVLITGVAGFIGSHLADKYLGEDYEVVGIDNFLTGSPKNITHLDSNSDFNFIEADISSKQEMEKLELLDISRAEKFDIILHFACPASPVDYFKFPLETMKVDSYGTFNTLELAQKMNATYILASTSEVYGDPEVHPQVESYWGNVNPNGPRSVYDEAKRFSEAAVMSYHREFGLDSRIVRIFNTYGPRMKINDGRVVPNFIYQVLKGEDITVYGDGSQSRSFCFVEDLVEGIFRFSTYNGLNGEVMNLGNPDEYKIIDFAKIILQKMNGSSKISFKDLPVDDPRQRKPDVSKAQKLIKWEAKTSLDNGLGKTIDFFKNIIENP
jgi:nucleoside-diphosphate-sugar epimerase